MQTVKFLTLGCKVNQYDTQSIRERFENAGFKEIDNGQKADIYLVNTCTVTHRADADSLNLIRQAKRENPQAKIIVTGCLAELDADKIKKIGGISLIVRNKEKETLVEYFLKNYRTVEPKDLRTNRGISFFKDHTRAFLKIQDGCDNSCAYCKVPLVRGSSRSRPISEVIQEAKNLVKSGFKEIVLCGICLGAYGDGLSPQISLLDVIEGIERIEGLLRIRLSSIEAADVSDGLIAKIAESKKLCPHLHIPIQSGDDEILKKMKRSYTRTNYINLIGKLKGKLPRIAITTDILAGFPGETEENFKNTLNLIKEILPLKVHIFPYSRRAGTLAASFHQELSPVIIKQRTTLLKNIARDSTLEYKTKFLGKDMDVLVECRVKDGPDFWKGYTNNYIKVLIKSNSNLKNQLIPVKLAEIVKGSVLAKVS